MTARGLTTFTQIPRTPKPVCNKHAPRVAPSLASTYTSAAQRLGRTTTAIGEAGEARSFCASSHAEKNKQASLLPPRCRCG